MINVIKIFCSVLLFWSVTVTKIYSVISEISEEMQRKWDETYGKIPLPFLVQEISHHPRSQINPRDLEDSGLFVAKNYYLGMQQALQLVKFTLGQPLSVDLIVSIHDAFARYSRREDTGGDIPLGLAPNRVRSGFKFGNLTLEGLNEFQLQIAQGIIKKTIFNNNMSKYLYWEPEAPLPASSVLPDVKYFYSKKMFVLRDNRCVNEHYDSIEGFIREYEAAIAAAIKDDRKTDHDRLIAITDFLQKFLRGHHFADGNGRTTLFLLLKKLLLENGLAPSVPFLSDIAGLSLAQAVSEISRGQQYFAQHKAAWIERSDLQGDNFDALLLSSPSLPTANDGAMVGIKP